MAASTVVTPAAETGDAVGLIFDLRGQGRTGKGEKGEDGEKDGSAHAATLEPRGDPCIGDPPMNARQDPLTSIWTGP